MTDEGVGKVAEREEDGEEHRIVAVAQLASQEREAVSVISGPSRFPGRRDHETRPAARNASPTATLASARSVGW